MACNSQSYSNDNFFESFNQKWYTHPVLKSLACTENGEILHIRRRRILKPRMSKMGLKVRLPGKIKSYLVPNFVYESYHNIPEVPLVKHIDGDIYNTKINNLALLHI